MVDIIGLGEVVVDWVAIIEHFPQPDEKVDSKEQMLFSGGVTANFSVASARQGIATGFVGAVGDDKDGDYLIDDFQKEKVDTTVCLKKSGMKTGVNFIFVVESSGEKTIIQSPFMQTTKLSILDIQNNKKYIGSAKLLHTTFLHGDISLEAMKIAKAAGVKVSLDLESQIASRGIDYFESVFKYVDILLPNKMGACSLTKTDDPKVAALRLIDMGINTVVLTLGSEGAMVFQKEGEQIKEYRAGAYDIHPVDTTGAGDTFCATFLGSHVVRGKSIESSLKIANAAAALKCLKLGARTGMPTENEIIEFLKSKNVNYHDLK